jgi:hypothetical protein
MAAGKYAVDTNVQPETSRAEIERTLTKYGARQFMYGWGEHEGLEVAVVGFQAHGRQVRFHLQMPDPNDKAFRVTETGRARTDKGAIAKAYEQAVRQRWRALALTIKALLEAVEVGILSFEEAFLANIMLPDGSSVGDFMLPQVATAYETASMPSLLPNYRKAIES